MVAMLAVDDETLLLLLLGFSSIFYFSLQQHHHHHHRQFIMYKWLKLEHGETSQLSFWLIYILDRDTHTHTLTPGDRNFNNSIQRYIADISCRDSSSKSITRASRAWRYMPVVLGIYTPSIPKVDIYSGYSLLFFFDSF